MSHVKTVPALFAAGYPVTFMSDGVESDMEDTWDYGYDDYVPDPRPDMLRFKKGDKVIVKPDKAEMWKSILHHPDRVFTITDIVYRDEGGWDIVQLDEPGYDGVSTWLEVNESYLVLADGSSYWNEPESKIVAIPMIKIHDLPSKGRKFR